MPAGDFVALAMRILDLHAHPDPRGREYADDTVSIQENAFGLNLLVIRLAKDADEPTMRRPVATTIVDETGAVIRHHDEHAVMLEHMRSLDRAATPGDAA